MAPHLFRLKIRLMQISINRQGSQNCTCVITEISGAILNSHPIGKVSVSVEDQSRYSGHVQAVGYTWKIPLR